MLIKALVTATVSGVLDALLPAFERASGHTVERWDATAGKVRDKLIEGALADVAFPTGSVIADIEKAGRIVVPSRKVLARSSLGVAIRKGAAKPDLAAQKVEKFVGMTGR